MKPGRYDVTIYRGAILQLKFTWTNHNLTGYSATAKFQEAGGGASLDGVCTIDGPGGAVTVRLEDDVTAAIAWDEGSWRLNLVEPDTDPEPFIRGLVKVRA